MYHPNPLAKAALRYIPVQSGGELAEAADGMVNWGSACPPMPGQMTPSSFRKLHTPPYPAEQHNIFYNVTGKVSPALVNAPHYTVCLCNIHKNVTNKTHQNKTTYSGLCRNSQKKKRCDVNDCCWLNTINESLRNHESCLSPTPTNTSYLSSP